MNRAVPWFVTALLLIIGLWMLYGIPFSTGFERIPGDEGDSRFNHYLLEHSYRWLTGHPLHRDVFSPPMFFPAGNSLAYSDAMAGYGWWYWPLRACGLDINTSYVLWMAIASSMNYIAMLVVLTRLFRIDLLSSAIGAFLFSFAVPRTAHLGHQQLLPHVYILFILAGLVLLARQTSPENPRHSIRNIAFPCALLVSGAVLQIYSGFYHLWFAVLGITVLAASGLLFKESRETIQSLVRRPVPLLISTLIILACSWPIVQLYLEVLKTAGPREMDVVYQMLPRWQSWLFTGPRHWLYGQLGESCPIFTNLPFANEHILGLGPVTTVLVILGLLRWRTSAWGKASLATMGLLMALTLYYTAVWNPWELVAQVFPGAGAIRAVSRIALLLLIPASVALAGRIHSIRHTWIKLALMGLVVAEQGMNIRTFDASAAQKRIAAIASVASQQDLPFYYVRSLTGNQQPQGREFVAQIDAMWAGLQANRPTVNGYSGNTPRGWMELNNNNTMSNQETIAMESKVRSWMQRNAGHRTPVNVFTIPP